MSKPVATDGTVYIYFPSIDSSGDPVAPSSAFVAGDFAIHKDGSATEKATTNGITVTSPFDSETGLHLLAIDTSNDTGDSGFWEDWASYSVRFNTAKTIDSRSIDGRPVPRGEFYIDPTYGTNKRDFVDAPNPTAVTAIQNGLATAASQLSVSDIRGEVVRFIGPSWTGSGWDKPFIKGDSYEGGLAVSITIENWSGDQTIPNAAEIKLSGTKTASGTTTTFTWDLDPTSASVNGSTTTILVDPSAADTNVEAGEYTADIRANWTSPAETHSLIPSQFKLVIKEPVSTF